MDKRWWGELSLKKCGPIKEAKLRLGKINVFIGPNGSGKTITGKILNSAFLEYFLKMMGEFLWKKEEEEYILKLYREEFWKWLNLPENLEGEYKFRLKEEEKVRREAHRDWGLKMSKAFFNFFPRREKREEFFKLTLVLSTSLLQKSFLRYVGPERLSIYESLKEQLPYLKMFLIFVQKGMEELSIWENPILHQKFKIEERNGEKVILELDSKVEFPYLSSGFQSSTWLDLYIRGVNKSREREEEREFFIIEEPEQHLFPSEQFELVKLFVSLVNSKSRDSITLITHSPYILFSLSLLMYAHYLGTQFPEKKKEVEKVIEPEYWLDPADFFGYQFNRNGEVTPIPQDEVGMITRDVIGKVKGELDDLFDTLLELEE